MRRLSRILLVCLVLLLTVPSQSVVPVKASPRDCPQEGCTVFIPLVSKPGLRLKIGLVTDTGGVADHSFNQAAWEGILDAEAKMGATGSFLVSFNQNDYATHINSFISQGYDLIITVGFLMGAATQTAAQAHPTQKFSIVDFAYDPTLSNVSSQLFSVEQPAFLAGYLAAGMTLSGKVATYGGMNIPPVTQFMDGYVQGVAYYNQENGTSVQVLGWDPVSKVGEFTNDFSNPAAGQTMGNHLLGEGADIIFPVAGETGLGTAQAVQLHPGALVIGVDTDWALTYPSYAGIVLTSVLKNVRATTYGVINTAYRDSFSGGNYYGTLANGGVELGTISSPITQTLVTKMAVVKAGIISGSIVVTP